MKTQCKKQPSQNLRSGSPQGRKEGRKVSRPRGSVALVSPSVGAGCTGSCWSCPSPLQLSPPQGTGWGWLSRLSWVIFSCWTTVILPSRVITSTALYSYSARERIGMDSRLNLQLNPLNYIMMLYYL